MSVAILNALELLNAKENPLVKIPTRKELTKLLKNASFDNFCKVFDELNHIRIREVPCLEAIGNVGIVPIDHPILGMTYCLAYRDNTIDEFEYKLVNAGLGTDEVTIHVSKHFNDKLECKNEPCYQIFLDEGEKHRVEHKEFSCNECCHYSIQNHKDVCLYDNEQMEGSDHCCNRYFDCFKWNKITEEKEN
jgi:hypothetical protein